MRRASFKIQKVLDEISERQARRATVERNKEEKIFREQRKLRRQRSGCRNPFMPVQQHLHGGQQKEIVSESIINVERNNEEKVPMPTVEDVTVRSNSGSVRKYSVILEEQEEQRVAARRGSQEQMMQPIRHLSGKINLNIVR